MNYTQEQIELAEQYMISPDPTVEQAAADFIEQWRISPESYVLAFKILTNSTHVYARFYSLVVTKEAVAQKWDQLPDTFKDSLRYYLTNNLSTFYSKSHLLSSACDILSLIGAFDFPERWPDFVDNLLDPNLIPKIQLTLLDHFTSIVTDGIYVTHARRAKLLNVILQLTPQINKAINRGLTQEDSMSAAFSVLDTQLKTVALDYYLQFGIIDTLLQLLTQPVSHNNAVQCLITIFIDQYDYTKLANYIPTLIHFFANSVSTIDSSSYHFLTLKVLHRYSSFIIYLISGMVPEIDVNHDFKNVSVDKIEVVQEDILTTLRVTLMNFPDEKQIDVFLDLWKCILPHLFSPPIINLPVFQYIKLLQPLIYESLFNVLPLAIVEHEMIDTVARICWNTLVYLFPNDVVEFLRKKTPSIALCYAIGVAEDTLPPELLHNIVQEQIGPLLELYSQTNDTDYIMTLNFVLSHGGREQLSDINYFRSYLDVTMKCLESGDENLHTEATRSLYYVVHRHTYLFLQGDLGLIKALCEKIPMLIQNLEESSLIRMFQICCFLAYQSKSEELFQILLQPISQIFNTFIGSILLQAPTPTDYGEFILTLISEIVCYFPQNALINFEAPLFQLLRTENIDKIIGINKFELVAKAIASIISCKPNEQIALPLTQLYEILSSKEPFNYLLFDSISIICEAHDDLDYLYKRIEAEYISTILKRPIDIEGITSLFRMISTFPLKAFGDVSVLTNLLSSGICHELSIVASAAANCACNIIKDLIDVQYLDHFINTLIPPLVQSLTDGVHITAIPTLVLLLYDVFLKHREFTGKDFNLIANVLLNSFSTLCPEPCQNFYAEFVQRLVNSIDNEWHFYNAVFDVLVNLRCATAVDLATFDVKDGPPMWMPMEVVASVNEIVEKVERMHKDEDFQPF
ncbi:exportin1 protein [Histomonas meleagridis]|uniref:exportin1 protein n=1 Tax=Histomonas meleagridis TaxID=135588 RepID=UPI003559FCA1|nr:exportin1 protein [Histomonas meleagridis]KAH0799738.1 exportin1 protein [Histomonas meleagridis]